MLNSLSTHERALEILQDSCRQAEIILTQARKKAATRMQKAMQKGQQSGTKSADSFAADIDALTIVVEQEFAGKVTKVAFSSAEEILLKKSRQENIVVAIAGVVVQSVHDAQHVTLRINPLDLDALEQAVEQLNAILRRAKSIELRTDSQVERGGIICYTESGIIDAQISTQLEELKRQCS